jgi:hypothetical protein
MLDVYLIEVKQRAVGLVARAAGDETFRFHAATVATLPLDGRSFASPDSAQHAARRLIEAASAPAPAKHTAAA